MTRRLYQFILRVHPPAFRRRFEDEMMSVFDDAALQNSAALLLDGLASLTRQWLLRTDSWKLLAALCGGFIQVFGFNMPAKGHQYWPENHQALAPSIEQVMLFALAFVCSLFIVIAFTCLWNTSFQRGRSVVHKRYRSALSTADRLGPIQRRT